jgi:hypothetical protein
VASVIITVEYCCAVCAYYFGDPDAARDFEVWCALIRIHQQNFHDIHRPPNAYLNDLLRPVYSVAHGHRCSAAPADRARTTLP